ncbi:hypothetical protein A5756_10520 [Mycobacterium sp. 852002-53434_SCH5985345]|uniref:AAA family ATPase n=1 Tax=Mycobacterium sp. 852002-53434_SCH5985345 TaxID=1834107 RepID=UPI0007FE920B|nr:AAA family ATPase [Mycobacterium sp. 852002-53434_SCH5985345]OBF56719.1 hypothetical protein A5756_10520 [Mycobacterium sp. 852002-53434_SCH5985345]
MSPRKDNPNHSAEGGSRAADAEAAVEASANGHNGHDLFNPADPRGDDPSDDGKTDLNGRRPGDEGYNLFNTKRANAKHAEDAQYGSAQAATVVGGLYAAEHGRNRGKFREDKGGYDAVAGLRSVSVADAKALGLIDQSPSMADVARWYSERGQTWEPTEASVTRAGLKAATKGLEPRCEIALTTIDALAAEGKPWAERAVAKAAADNLDAAVALKNKPYAFTLSELYRDPDTTVDDLIGLPPMTTETRLASLRLLREWAAVENQRAQADARKRLAATEAAEITLPPVIGLDALLATPDDPVRMRIEGLWPSGGAKVLCAAPAGAGKTTLSGNLVRSLADGDPFLGAFEVRQRAERIVIIDNEMTTEVLKRWLRRQGIDNTAAVVDVVCLRGQAGLFDLGNDRLRDMWTRRLADLGCDFVIFDCLSPVINAMGVKESNEMGKLLYPLTDMLTAAGVADALVHHHMGHEKERARGDSTALGWSDANWKIVREAGKEDRYFAADKVRDADNPVPEGLLSWDQATGRLTYAGGNRADTGKRETVETRVIEVRNVLADRHAECRKDDKGMTTTDLKKAVGGNKRITDEAIRLAEKRGLVTFTRTGVAKLYQITPEAMDPLFDGGDPPDADNGIAPVIDPRAPGAEGPSGR